ncbi:hypothetical protein, partial [uncultured Flavobacterium sp.]|uniref:hypothetical protein n=1 Tax=uncultured Flavobacterium sp. TaxID=165435 RepID=UPI0030CA3CFD
LSSVNIPVRINPNRIIEFFIILFFKYSFLLFWIFRILPVFYVVFLSQLLLFVTLGGQPAFNRYVV